MQLLNIREPGQTPVPHADGEVAVGIDLGTTNSLVAVSAEGKPEVLRDPEGVGMIPSIVAYVEDGAPLVGEEARRSLLERPENVVSSIKRLMGRGVEDVLNLAGTLPYDVLRSDGEDPAPGHGGDRMVRLNVAGRRLTPVEISAEILRTLKARAESQLGRDIAKAVVTVPAHFDDGARTATRDAARLAGLEVLRLVNEPTAAALAYGLDKDVEGLYAVYDLGGGTFDISILRLQTGVFQVLATGGDAALGGDDFDQAVAEAFLADRVERTAETLEISSTEVKTAMAAARLAKECLSRQRTGEWMLEAGGRLTRHSLDRTRLEALIAPLVERTITISREVMLEASIDASDIQGVVLVGGSTRVPLVRRRVAEFFGREPLADIDPDEVVAMGAALQAEALTAGSDTLLLDVTPLSLGIETMGGLAEKVIPRNSPTPVARAQEFTTYQDGQSAMMIHVVQGEREMVDQCRSLARFELHGIPPMTAGAARIRVTFAVDADGLLTVSAREAATGVEQRVEVKPSYGLSEDDMMAMLRESMVHARDDMARRLLAEARVEAGRTVLAVRSALAADGDLLSGGGLTAIDGAVVAVEEAMAGDDREIILERVEKLDIATREFAARRMDRGVQAALEGVSVDSLEDRIGAGGKA